MADRPDTGPGLDLAIQAVTRRRDEARQIIQFHRSAGRSVDACLAASNAQTVERILADLHALRQEAVDA